MISAEILPFRSPNTAAESPADSAVPTKQRAAGSLFDRMLAAQHDDGCPTCGRWDAEVCPWPACPNRQHA